MSWTLSNALEVELKTQKCREGCLEPIAQDDLSGHYAQVHPEKWKQIREWKAELDNRVESFALVVVDQENNNVGVAR
jgi:hypothetical protein